MFSQVKIKNMKNILENLGTIGGEVKSETTSSSYSIEFSLSIKLTKGSFSQSLDTHGRLYKSNHYKGCYLIEDFDYDTQNSYLGDFEIDNVELFKKMLKDGGLSSLSNQVGFDWHDIYNAVCFEVSKSELLRFFTDGFECLHLLTKEQQLIIRLNNYLDNPLALVNNLSKDEQAMLSISYVNEVVTREDILKEIEHLKSI